MEYINFNECERNLRQHTAGLIEKLNLLFEKIRFLEILAVFFELDSSHQCCLKKLSLACV